MTCGHSKLLNVEMDLILINLEGMKPIIRERKKIVFRKGLQPKETGNDSG